MTTNQRCAKQDPPRIWEVGGAGVEQLPRFNPPPSSSSTSISRKSVRAKVKWFVYDLIMDGE